MKKLISLLLTVCLMLGIVNIAAADVPADWQPFAERVKITVPVYDRSKEGFPAVDDNYWTKWVQENFGDKYNIDVQYVAIPRGDVMTKYSLLIAADDTPTILMEKAFGGKFDASFYVDYLKEKFTDLYSL